MKTSWTHGLDKEVKSDVKSNFLESLVTRKRLKELLEDKSKTNRNSAISKSSYDNPNWSYLQADSVGYQRALKEVIELIS